MFYSAFNLIQLFDFIIEIIIIDKFHYFSLIINLSLNFIFITYQFLYSNFLINFIIFDNHFIIIHISHYF